MFCLFTTIMEINKDFLGKLFGQAVVNPRLRQNLDLRTSTNDNSQRMLNALLPGTVVPIHRHPQSTENVFLLCGKIVEVIYEAKDGKYGEDGSETFDAFKVKEAENKEQVSATFSNSLGDLKKNIEYLIGMERQSGSMDVITPLYVSRMLNVPLEEVEKVMKGMFK